MVENETEMIEKIEREAQKDMTGTKKGHVKNLVIVRTGQPEIPRKRNGREDTMKEEIE